MREARNSSVAIYRPDARLRTGVFGALLRLWHEAWARRWHIWISFKRDFRAAHAGAGLGVFWNFALPLAPVGAYAGLTYMRAFPPIEDMPALVYIGVGVTLWFLFTGFITGPMSAVQSQHAAVAQTSFPLVGVVASSLGRVAFETLVRVALVACITLILAWPLPISGLLAFALLIPALIFFAACGLLLSMLNLIFPDFGRVIQILLTYLIFVSETIFPIPNNSSFALILKINPFSVFIDNIRHMLVVGQFSDWQSYAFMSALGLVILLVGARVFYIMEWRIRGYSL